MTGRSVHHDGALGGVAAPDRDGELRGDAAVPQVARVLGRAGLARDGLVYLQGLADDARGAARLRDALHHVDGRVRHGGGEHLLRLVLVLVYHVAVAVLDLGDGHGVAVVAAGRNRGVALRHLDDGDADGAERDGVVRRDVHVDAHVRGHLRDLVRADRLDHLHEARVGGQRERLREGDGAVARVAEVVDLPGGGGLQRGVAVDIYLRVHASVERRAQRVRLEARARLALGLRGEVELVGLVVAAADHGLDVARGGIDRHERRLQLVVADAVQVLADAVLGRGLHGGVDGGVDLQAALHDGVLVEVLEQQRLDVVREVRVLALGVLHRAFVRDELLLLGGVTLLPGDVARGVHALEHDVAALLGGLRVLQGVVHGRRLRKSAQRRRLGEREVLRVLVEVGDGGGLDAVCAVAKVDRVEVHVQDLLLREHLLHLDGDVGLAHLALERHVELLVREDRVSHQLLGDGGGALGAAAQLHGDRAQDALRVNAVMLVEADVLRVDDRLQGVVRDLARIDAATVLDVVLRNHGAVGRIHRRRLGHEVRLCRGVVGQVLEPVAHDAAERHEERQGKKRQKAKETRNAKTHRMGARVPVSPASANAHITLPGNRYRLFDYKGVNVETPMAPNLGEKNKKANRQRVRPSSSRFPCIRIRTPRMWYKCYNILSTHVQ